MKEDLLDMIGYTTKMKKVTVYAQGLKGYGVDYGVCFPYDCTILITCTLDELGKVIYNLLAEPRWEDFLLKVTY